MKKKSHLKQTLLTEFEYCYQINKFTGAISLVEGPYRIPKWKRWLSVYNGVHQKIILKEGQYVVIVNPYNTQTGENESGERVLRKGPCIFSLYPGEVIENGKINKEYVITTDRGLILRAIKEFEDSTGYHQAGECWILHGPLRYIPHKYVLVEKEIYSIPLGIDEGIYIQNVRTGVIRLIKGPQSLVLKPNEIRFERSYNSAELKAFKIEKPGFDRFRAIPLKLENSELALIISENQEQVKFGPQVILLEPHERIKIIKLSGDTPKRPNVLVKWKIFTGPMFVSDQLVVRTKDNAQLVILVRYKTRFDITEENPKKIFTVTDFVGYATETLAAIIRQEAASNFEKFHSNASELIRSKIFHEGKDFYRFSENGFTIFGLDIKKIAPEDPEIAAQLNAAIKSNMDIYVSKINQTAQLEAERQLVAGRIGIEEAKKALLELEQANSRYSELDTAEIQAKKTVTIAEAKADATRIKEHATNEMSSEKMAKTLELMENKTIDSYLHLQKILSFTNVEKTVVIPSDSRVIVPFGDMTNLTSSESF